MFVQQLLQNLNVDKFMKKPHCDRQKPPYTPTDHQGWNLDSKLLILFINNVW